MQVGDIVKVVKLSKIAPLGFVGEVQALKNSIGNTFYWVKLKGLNGIIASSKLESLGVHKIKEEEVSTMKRLYSVRKVYTDNERFKIYPAVEVVADSEEAAKIASGVYTPMEGEDPNFVTISITELLQVKERK